MESQGIVEAEQDKSQVLKRYTRIVNRLMWFSWGAATVATLWLVDSTRKVENYNVQKQALESQRDSLRADFVRYIHTSNQLAAVHERYDALRQQIKLQPTLLDRTNAEGLTGRDELEQCRYQIFHYDRDLTAIEMKPGINFEDIDYRKRLRISD